MENNTKYEFENRRYVLGGAVILLVIIFIIRLFILQVVDNDYKAWADSNAFLKKTLYPSRGMMYDRNGKLLVYNQPAYDVMLIMQSPREKRVTRGRQRPDQIQRRRMPVASRLTTPEGVSMRTGILSFRSNHPFLQEYQTLGRFKCRSGGILRHERAVE